MTRRRKPSRSLKFAVLSAALCLLCGAASCGQDGVTTNCPALPRYQTFPLGDSSVPDAMSQDSQANQEAFAAALDAGCVTGPSGVGSPAAGGGGNGGTGGKGSGGKAGSGGKSAGGNGGETSSGGEGGSADNAGAAGRN